MPLLMIPPLALPLMRSLVLPAEQLPPRVAGGASSKSAYCGPAHRTCCTAFVIVYNAHARMAALLLFFSHR